VLRFASRSRRRLIAALVGAAALAATAARADDFLGGDWTTGDGYRGFDVKAGVNLDSRGDWEGGATYAYDHSYAGTESRARELSLGVVHRMDAAWSSRFSLTGWRDNLNDVDYVGPSFGFTYVRYDDPSSPDRRARLKVSFDSDLFDFIANETTAPKTIRLTRTSTATIAGDQSSVSVAQWHPYFTVELPLDGGRVSPWILVGHDFYSKNPELIEERAGRPQFSTSANSLNGLVGGLVQNTDEVGINVRLPWRLRATASLGVEQIATDNTWATTQSAGLSGWAGEHLKLAVSWSRSIQDGVPQELLNGGLTWFF
jgi:hypothetical protein